MNAQSTLRERGSEPRRRMSPIPGLCLIAACTARPAEALVLQNCRPTDSALVCRLESILTLLYAAAAILALLLTLAIVFAIRAYRRKSPKLTPDDINSDAD